MVREWLLAHVRSPRDNRLLSRSVSRCQSTAVTVLFAPIGAAPTAPIMHHDRWAAPQFNGMDCIGMHVILLLSSDSIHLNGKRKCAVG